MPTLIPNAKQTFFGNGAPLAGGSVYMYAPGTSTFQNTYQDVNQTVLNTNPIILDANGQASIWGTGQYRQKVVDASGNVIWDQVTEDTTESLLGNYCDNVFIAASGGFVPGTTTYLTLSAGPGSLFNMWVFFDGLEQSSNTYTLSGNIITFLSPIPLGVTQVTVKVGSSIAGGSPPAGSVVDNSVATGTKLYNRINDLKSLRDFGAVCNGTNDDTAAVNAAIAALTSSGATLLIPGPTLVSANVTFPASIILMPVNGGYFVGHAGNEVITISSVPQAAYVKLFSHCVPKSTIGMTAVPEWFGAVGDGVTDNINAFNMMVAFLASGGGGAISIPPRTYCSSQQITINTTNISIRGEDRHLSRVLFGQTNGFVYELDQAGGGSGNDYQGVNVSNLTLLTNNTTQTGASIGKFAIGYFPTAPNTGSPYPAVRVKNIELRGLYPMDGAYPSFWNTGIYVDGATNALVDDAVILGAFNYQYMSYGVYADTLSISTQITNSQFCYMGTGAIQYSNESTPIGSEGLQVIGCQMNLVGVGVVKDNGASPEPRPLTLVTGSFINATGNCVQTSNCTESVITGNDFYVQAGPYVPVIQGAAAIALNNPVGDSVNRHVISNNIIRGLVDPSITVNGCVIGVGHCVVDGNSFDGFDYGVVLTSTANNVGFGANVYDNIKMAQVLNQGTGNGNWYCAKTVMPDNSGFNII